MEEQDAGAVPQPATGDSRIDEAVGQLGELAGLPVGQHPAVFARVHRRLAEVLGELDQDATGS